MEITGRLLLSKLMEQKETKNSHKNLVTGTFPLLLADSKLNKPQTRNTYLK